MDSSCDCLFSTNSLREINLHISILILTLLQYFLCLTLCAFDETLAIYIVFNTALIAR